jgi:hypothetical protein
MTSSLFSNGGGSVERPSSRLAEIRDEIQRARPALPEDSDEYRTAVLLLLVAETGLNVDRLAMRARYPREFVSRCVRRLADNALWVDGALACTWGADRARSQEFWWDVEVALGRQLRRVGADGRPEWGSVDGWFKDFEYTSRHADEKAVYNEYRYIAAHDPDPFSPVASSDEDGIPEATRGSDEHAEAALPKPAVAPVPDAPPVLGEWPTRSHWLTSPEPDVTVPAERPLGKEWSKADWLM